MIGKNTGSHLSLIVDDKLEYEDMLDMGLNIATNENPKVAQRDIKDFSERTTRKRSRRSSYHVGDCVIAEREEMAREQARPLE